MCCYLARRRACVGVHSTRSAKTVERPTVVGQTCCGHSRGLMVSLCTELTLAVEHLHIVELIFFGHSSSSYLDGTMTLVSTAVRNSPCTM
jgi:hypothetical protein